MGRVPGVGQSGAMAGQHALIGFGEAASTFAAAGGWASPVRAFDIDPPALAVPLLLSRPAAQECSHQLGAIGLTGRRVLGAETAQTSTIRMIRAVKGIEALTEEMMAAAGAADVVDETLALLGTEPTMTVGTVARQRAAGERGRNVGEDWAAWA